MKRVMKCGLAVLLCLCMIGTTVFVPVFAAQTVVYEDFSGYEIQEEYTESGVVVPGWRMALCSGAQLNTEPTAKIADHKGTPAMAMTGTSAGYTQYIERQNFLAFEGDKSGIGSSYRIHFAFDKSSAMNGFGIKFAMEPDDQNSYYFLWITGGKDGESAVWTFSKVESGSVRKLSESIYTYATYSSRPGSLTDGEVDIIVNGGDISWTVTGTRYQNQTGFVDAGGYTDVKPTKTEPSKLGIAFNATNDNAGACTYLTEFSIENVAPYVDYEPVSILYQNVSSFAVENDFAPCAIRRVYLPDAVDTTQTIEFTTAGGQTVSRDLEFDDSGWAVNMGDKNTDYVSATIPGGMDPSELLLLTEGVDDNTISMDIDESSMYMYPRIGGSVKFKDFDWQSSDEKILEVSNRGVMTANRKGEAVVTVGVNGVNYYKVNVVVRGELDKAIEDGNLNEYLADKKQVFDAMNNAAETEDFEAMKKIVTGEAEYSLNYIKDIILDEVAIMDDNELNGFVSRLLTYKNWKCKAPEDIYNLQAVIDQEVATGKFDSIDDIEEMELIIDTYGEELGMNMENRYLQKYKAGVAAELLETVFENAAELKAKMAEVYVMDGFWDSVGYTVVKDVLAECAIEIGYDTELYKKNGEDDVCKYLLKNKNSIETVEQLKRAIDSYVPEVKPTPSPSPVVGPSGGGGGNGGYSGGFAAKGEIIEAAQVNPLEDKAPLFEDVKETDWFYNELKHLKGIGAVSGYDEEGKLFGPDINITRAEFLKILLVTCGFELLEEVPEDAKELKDITPEDWFYPYIITAQAEGLIYGDDKSNANPNAQITREEMATILSRTADAIGFILPGDNMAQNFADDDLISDWAYSAVIAIKNAGLISGYPDGTFGPQNNATRAEVVKLVSNFSTAADKAAEEALAAAEAAAAEAK